MNSPQHSSTSAPLHIFVTSGAGYIDLLLTGVLLSRGQPITVVDDLPFDRLRTSSSAASPLQYWRPGLP